MSKLYQSLIISAAERLRLIAFETTVGAKDLIIGNISGDNFYPSDDCTLQDDGNYKIGSTAVDLCNRQGLQLIIIK